MRKHWSFEEIIDILCTDPEDGNQAENGGADDNEQSASERIDVSE